jgi:hypothetical protein
VGDGFAKQHVPTGRVTFESIVMFLLMDLEVRPREQDWYERITEAEQLHKRYRTWS